MAVPQQPKKDGCGKEAATGLIILVLIVSGLMGLFSARTKRDGLKRKVAQALNSMAKAISDVADIYIEFKDVHPEHAAYLEKLIVQIGLDREALISFAKASWDLDETGIMSYI